MAIRRLELDDAVKLVAWACYMSRNDAVERRCGKMIQATVPEQEDVVHKLRLIAERLL